jgi:pimeloyl-ACP methyl ester carboxylesterase
MQSIKSVDVKDRRTRVLIEGGADRPPILLLHGIGRSLEDWELASSAGFGSEVHPILRLVATPVLGALATRYSSRASARMHERRLYVDRSLATDERIDHALNIARQSDTGVVLHETARSLATVRGVRSEWREELMANVSRHLRPTLIVWGERDRILPAKQIDAAHRLLPHARVHLFEAVSHMPQVEAAVRFAELTVDFLRSQAAA